MKARPNILTIAGFDPSNGAGLTADVKTFEVLKCYGLSVCTANTVQDDQSFQDCYWLPIEQITAQIKVLFNRFQIDIVKIGIVENFEVLNAIIDSVLSHNSKAKIVLDPVLKSSSNFQFHSNSDLDDVLGKIELLTPNYKEIELLYPDKNIEETITHITKKTNLFLKGGHRLDKLGKDELYTKNGKKYSLNPKLPNCSEKHGSGCVLSSAIASYLALSFPLLKACYRGKRYTEKFLSSNKGLLGYHSKK
ncbi:phosphomethylpyrimidine kinase [Tenacibaculum holothuriorum]|uniref:hydroxymethylpyrimidine kinase n=1 Tax=Tenacibaculum holothuriorum TaxID=1635173 RepID=A0A1Y2P8Q6_9FLAO|nr:hydroxymethylpyrimidine/phosphomethylpyrimidine kinase [Tenacibaculum holothuriorum]OSY86845.1 phosphomethylpyrimidine kinase [Tenacibaculum holothuriorum]